MNEALDVNKRRAPDALTELRAYAGTDAIKALTKLLLALEAQYKADLETVQVDKLITLQTSLRQIAALRRAITEGEYLDPKIS